MRAAYRITRVSVAGRDQPTNYGNELRESVTGTGGRLVHMPSEDSSFTMQCRVCQRVSVSDRQFHDIAKGSDIVAEDRDLSCHFRLLIACSI